MISDTVYDLSLPRKDGLFEFKLEVRQGISIPAPKGDIEDAGGTVDVVLDAENAKKLHDAIETFAIQKYLQFRADKPDPVRDGAKSG